MHEKIAKSDVDFLNIVECKSSIYRFIFNMQNDGKHRLGVLNRKTPNLESQVVGPFHFNTYSINALVQDNSTGKIGFKMEFRKPGIHNYLYETKEDENEFGERIRGY